MLIHEHADCMQCALSIVKYVNIVVLNCPFYDTVSAHSAAYPLCTYKYTIKIQMQPERRYHQLSSAVFVITLIFPLLDIKVYKTNVRK